MRMPLAQFTGRKSLEAIAASNEGAHGLAKTLGPFSLIGLGIGCIIGAGIFVLTGKAAASYAGPAISLSFVLAGVACAFVGLCYAELAAMLPVSSLLRPQTTVSRCGTSLPCARDSSLRAASCSRAWATRVPAAGPRPLLLR